MCFKDVKWQDLILESEQCSLHSKSLVRYSSFCEGAVWSLHYVKTSTMWIMFRDQRSSMGFVGKHILKWVFPQHFAPGAILPLHIVKSYSFGSAYKFWVFNAWACYFIKNKAPLGDVDNAKNTTSATFSETQGPSCTAVVAFLLSTRHGYLVCTNLPSSNCMLRTMLL